MEDLGEFLFPLSEVTEPQSTSLLRNVILLSHQGISEGTTQCLGRPGGPAVE